MKSNKSQPTSLAAFHSLNEWSGTQRERIYAHIVNAGIFGATDEEGEVALGIKCQSYTPRRGELARDKRIVDSGRTRQTTSGREAIVWIVTSPSDGDQASGVQA